MTQLATPSAIETFVNLLKEGTHIRLSNADWNTEVIISYNPRTKGYSVDVEGKDSERYYFTTIIKVFEFLRVRRKR